MSGLSAGYGAVAAAMTCIIALAGAGAPAQRPAREAVMMLIEGGQAVIGSDRGDPAEAPAHRVTVQTFLLDRTPVTVRQFRRFVRETGYRTDAERLGGGVLDPASGAWRIERQANWRTPVGPRGYRAVDDHPVTQVSWNDAVTFCRHYGARLPSEAEWEFAARQGQTPDGVVFEFGRQPIREGQFLANFFQGVFPVLNTGRDGWRFTSPVGRFGLTPVGLADMAGNVWNWTSDWYGPYGAPRTAQRERTLRGGSFLCDSERCQGFRVSSRSHATPDSALMHVGFRCAADRAAAGPRLGRVERTALR